MFVFLFENQNLLSIIAAEYTTNLINYYYLYVPTYMLYLSNNNVV